MTAPGAPSAPRARRTRRSDRLLGAVSGFGRIVILTHDNPDPDAIAGGWALHTLFTARLGTPVRLVGGGAIVRAENVHLVKLLEPPIELLPAVDVSGDVAVVLVDCGFGTDNHLLAETGVLPVAVIDHHEPVGRPHRLRFRDVREGAAAAASIAASYLREQGIEPSPRLATALVYAIRSETRGSQTHHSRLDRSILRWLHEWADPALLAEIESAPLPRAWYGDLAEAMRTTMVFDDAAFCLLSQASGPEIVGELADLLIRCDGVKRVLCGAFVGDDLLVSVRTSRRGDDAAQLVRRTLHGLGGGGGHQHRAGGKVPDAGAAPRDHAALGLELRRRWLTACGLDTVEGVPLNRRA